MFKQCSNTNRVGNKRKKEKNQYKGKPNYFKSGRREHFNHTGFSSEAQELL